MDVVYEQGEWLSEIIAILKIRYAYSSGSMGIEMEYGNINLLQQRLWVPQESIKDLSPTLASLMSFWCPIKTIASKEDAPELLSLIRCGQLPCKTKLSKV